MSLTSSLFAVTERKLVLAGINKEPSQAEIGGPNLPKENYLYHSVTGFNLDKLTSILASGVLSKKAGYGTGVNVQSQGTGLNGDQFVSLATYEVLNNKNYSGKNLGVIIDPKGLWFKPTGSQSSLFFFERQVSWSVPKENIVGITVPLTYKEEDFLDSQLFYIPWTGVLKEGMNSLEQFYLRTLKVSLFADQKLKLAFEKALSLPQIIKELSPNSESIKPTNLEHAIEEEFQMEFNLALMKRIKKVYRDLIKKDRFSLVDIVQFHVGNTMPIYFTTGELVTNDR